MGMPDWLTKIIEKIRSLNHSIDNYNKDTVIQSLPAVALVNRAKKLYENEKYLEAKLILDRAMELPQKDARVLKYQGMVAEKLGQTEQAVEYFQDSADLNPNDKNIWQKLGFALIAVNKFVEAEKSFENSDKVAHGNTDTYTGWGMALMKQQRHAEAREKFIIATKINRYNFTAIFLAAVMDMRLNDLDKAETRLAFLANVNPNESNTYEYAHLKFIKKDYDNALFYAKKSLEYNSNMLPAYLLIADVYALNWDVDNTLKTYEKAEEKDLISAPLYLEWGLALEKFDRFEEAVKKLQKAYELMPDDKDIISNLALCYYITGQKDAIDALQQLPEDKFAYKLMQAIDKYKNNDIEAALSEFRGLAEENLSCALVDYYMAKCYEILNNDTKVRDCYNSSVDKNPIFFRAYKDFAIYCYEHGDYAEAQRKLRKALKLDENNLEILNLLFFVCYKLVKDNVCEYNVKEALSFAQTAEKFGRFDYPDEKSELSELLKTIQEK